MTKKQVKPESPPTTAKRILNITIFVASLYVFLLSIEMISGTLSGFKDFARFLLTLTNNPVVGLFIGILTTAIIQSSSATTSLVVCLVASGTMSVNHAIPIIMGANIGTTITNTMVSLFHISRKDEFVKAFPGAIVHDIFNILTVIVLFPIEIFLHPLEIASNFLAKGFTGIGGFKVLSPLKFIIEPVWKLLQSGIDALLKLIIPGSKAYGTVLILVSLAVAVTLLFVGLTFMVKGMRKLTGSKTEVFIDRYLFGGPVRAFLVGLIITSIIQSSSVTTSFIVPLVGAGLVTIEQIFPYTLGANIGTTITAILASLVTGSPLAIQVAFAHSLFNIFGTILWYPLRIVPVAFAKGLGRLVAWKRWMAFVYIVIVFIIIPVGLILLLRR